MANFTIYYDSASDELLARAWLSAGPLGQANLVRLPSYTTAPAHLRDLLVWERLDWVVCTDDRPVCAVEFSRHGYTGDNSFQRFARLYRAASLGVPVIYFTSFARARLNELDEGRNSPRNVAPELFQTMDRLSERFGVPCLGVNWPIATSGTPAPLVAPAVAGARAEVVSLVEFFAAHGNPGPNGALADAFPATVAAMKAQAALPFRGSETRGPLSAPVSIQETAWVREWLPQTYFQRGKADKILASYALDLVTPKPLTGGGSAAWRSPDEAWVLFLGYQWRPDPSCGLIALSAANAVAANVPLIVVWPRVFLAAGDAHTAANAALAEFQAHGTGPLLAEGQALGFDQPSLTRFRARLSAEPNQLGIYTSSSKVDRILRDTAAAVVFADAVVAH